MVAYYIDFIVLFIMFLVFVICGFRIINKENIVNKSKGRKLLIQIKDFSLKSKWISLPLLFSICLMVISSILVTLNKFDQHSNAFKSIVLVMILLCISLPIITLYSWY